MSPPHRSSIVELGEGSQHRLQHRVASRAAGALLTESAANNGRTPAVGEGAAYRVEWRRGGRGRHRHRRGARRPSRQGPGGRRCPGAGTAHPPRPLPAPEPSCFLYPPAPPRRSPAAPASARTWDLGQVSDDGGSDGNGKNRSRRQIRKGQSTPD